MIPAKGKITVRSTDFDNNPRGFNSQIFILFRAGDADNKVEFLQEFRQKQRSGFKLEKGEQFELHDGLSNVDLHLTCLERQVTGDGTAGQEKEEGKDKQSKQNAELENLSAVLQGLKTKIEDLQKDMELLESLFKSFAEGRT